MQPFDDMSGHIFCSHSGDIHFQHIVAGGAQYESTDVWQPKVVVDGRLMTGQNPASAGPLATAMVEALRKNPR